MLVSPQVLVTGSQSGMLSKSKSGLNARFKQGNGWQQPALPQIHSSIQKILKYYI